MEQTSEFPAICLKLWRDLWQQHCRIPDLDPVHIWANKFRMMPGDVTAVPGMYDVSITPWIQEIGESYDDRSISTTVLCLASRLGKTESILNLIGRTIHQDPRNILMAYPTLESAEKWSLQFLQPMFDHSPVFDDLIAPQNSRDGTNRTLAKKFPGGTITGIGANSPSAFRQIQAPVICLDEIDAMNNTKEGDPITLAFKRADNYADSIQVLSSTPTVKGYSRIWSWLEASDWRQWFVPSPHTGNEHVLAWKNVIWPKNKSEKAVYVDPETGESWTEEQRRDAVMAGSWKPTQEFKGIRGYQANGLISLFSPKKGYKSKYHQFAAEFLDAKHKGFEELQVWTNTFLAEAWEDPTVESVSWEPLFENRDSYETEPLPDRVLMLTICADVQADRIEFEWVGWCNEYESYGLKYGVISGDTKRKEIWDKFKSEIRREWKHSAGGSLRVDKGFVDEGHNPQMVRKFCLSLLRVGIEIYPCKGIGRAGPSDPELVTFNPNRKQSGIKAPTYNVGSNRAKKTIYMNFDTEPGNSNAMQWTDQQGAGYDERYFQMLTSERQKKKYHLGQEYKMFEKPSSATRNEALDIRAYGYACAVSMNPSWDSLRKRITRLASREVEIKETAEKVKKESAKVKKRAARKRTPGGFVNAWKG